MNLGLFPRLVISIGSILCIAIIVSGYLLVDYSEQRFKQSRQSEAQTLAYTLAEGSIDGLITQDFEHLERLVGSITENKTYVYAYFTTELGQILTHSDSHNVSEFVEPLGKLNAYISREIKANGNIITEVVYPVKIDEHYLANAHLGYIYDNTVFFREQATTIILVLVSFFLLMVILIFIISRHVVTPLTQLTTLISQASFNSPQVISPQLPNRRDEVALLANAFNKMQEELFSSYREIQQESLKLREAISEREIALKELRLSAAVVENTAEAIIITDKSNKIVSANKAFFVITGYSQEEVLGQNPKLLHSGKHHKSFYKDLWASIIQSGQWQGELWDRRKNGEIFPTWNTITAIYDDHNEIINYVSVFSDISTLKKSQEKLDFLAHHDPLTNLPNRLLLNDRIEHALLRADRERKQVGILFLDLDRFKNINDSLGHPVGDVLLKNAADRIVEIVRKEDTVARLGGDEFIIVAEDITDTRDIVILGEKVIAAFQQPFLTLGHKLFVTTSIGISLYPNDGHDSATLLKNADVAMYRAKEEGRNEYQFYTHGLSSQVFQRLTLENSLRQSISRNELVLHYQPQYNLENDQLVGVEALLRWQHSYKGLLPPNDFIELAEESGLIIPIGEWVIHSAFSQMKHWQNKGYDIGRIAINVSGIQFQRGNIVQTFSHALTQTGVDPRCIELEITESSLMHKVDWVIDVLKQLKLLGFTIAIDDFGTGYSSLSYLKRLPIDKLKIDQSFVRDITENPNDEAITRAVIALGKSLQLGVIAEGIETEEQKTFLKSLACEEGQGFYYGKPMTADALERFFESENHTAMSIQQRQDIIGD